MSVISPLTTPFSAVYLHTMTNSSLSPCGRSVSTPLSAHSIVISPPFLFQVPDGADLSPFLSSADAGRNVRAKSRLDSATMPAKYLNCIMFDPPTVAAAPAQRETDRGVERPRRIN